MFEWYVELVRDQYRKFGYSEEYVTNPFCAINILYQTRNALLCLFVFLVGLTIFLFNWILFFFSIFIAYLIISCQYQIKKEYFNFGILLIKNLPTNLLEEDDINRTNRTKRK